MVTNTVVSMAAGTKGSMRGYTVASTAHSRRRHMVASMVESMTFSMTGRTAPGLSSNLHRNRHS